MFCSLAYLPHDKISPAFTFLECVCQSNYPFFLRFCAYFKKQWINSIVPSVWSVAFREIHTNNHAEGFNNKIKTMFGRVTHPNLSIFFLT